MNIFLIDFENVREGGLAGIERLERDDALYCFFTENAPRISLSVLSRSRTRNLQFIEVGAGKQNLDMALMSYLGYLIGSTPAQLLPTRTYYIVSADTDFLKPAAFWTQNRLPVTIRTCQSIEDALSPAPAPQQRKKPEPPKAEPARQEAPKAEPAKPAPAPAVNMKDVKKLMEADGVSGPAFDFVRTQMDRYAAEPTRLSLIYRAVVKKFGQKEGTRVYNLAKKHMLK